MFQGKFYNFDFYSNISQFTFSSTNAEMNAFRFQGNNIEELIGASLQMPVKQSILIQDNTIISLSSTAFRCELIRLTMIGFLILNKGI